MIPSRRLDARVGGFLADPIGEPNSVSLLRASRTRRHNIFRRKDHSNSNSHDYNDNCIPDPDAPSGKGGKGGSSRSQSSTGKAGKGKGKGRSSRSDASTGKGKGKGRRRGRHKKNRRESRRLRGGDSIVGQHPNISGVARELYGKGGNTGSHDDEGSCPPGFVLRPPSSKEELQLAIRRYIESDGEDSFYGPTINDWDVSRVTDFSTVFENAETFNDPIGDWDTSQATSMASMFRNAALFDQDISRWVSYLSNSKRKFFLSG